MVSAMSLKLQKPLSPVETKEPVSGAQMTRRKFHRQTAWPGYRAPNQFAKKQ